MIDLKPLFFDLEIKKAHEDEKLHELGRLLRDYRGFIYPRKSNSESVNDDQEYSPGEKALLRALNRRNS